MLGKMLELWFDDECVRRMEQLTARETNNLVPIDPAMRKQQTTSIEDVTDDVRAAVRALFEQEFTTRSDDGLLEHLIDLGSAPTATERMRGAAYLARRIQDRDLFKILGRAGGDKDLAMANETYTKFAKDPNVRRKLEMQAPLRRC